MEVQRVLNLIVAVDRCLGGRPRSTGDYSEGLIADAANADALLSPDKDERFKFLCWVTDNREHPAMPRTTAELLEHIQEVIEMRKGTQ
jgi:hypothetical protein